LGKALCYQLEGRGFDSRKFIGTFYSLVIFAPTVTLGVESD
jgi:hypothetical protein